MKEFLSREGVSFIVRNVDEDEGAYDQLIAIGLRTVPATLVGERTLTGYDPAALGEAIAEYRAQS